MTIRKLYGSFQQERNKAYKKSAENITGTQNVIGETEVRAEDLNLIKERRMSAHGKQEGAPV